jgi:hypothetical protein
MALSITNAQIETEITDLITTVRDFAATELYMMVNAGQGNVVFPINKRNILVGRFSITYVDEQWCVRNYHNELLHSFYNKSAALYFALAMMQRRFKLADSLRASDTAFQHASTEFDIYTSKSRKTREEFKFHLYTCKLEESKIRLRAAASEMKKSLISAKYINNAGTQPWNYDT